MKEIVFEDYNGWSNRDTWLVALWLNNDYNNYMGVKNLIKGVGTGKTINDYNDLKLYDRLKRFHYGDSINWNNVNIKEIRTMLEEMGVE